MVLGLVYIWVMAAGEVYKAAAFELPGGGGGRHSVNILGNEHKIYLNTQCLL